jgi:CBS-domain-containing membrane protein
MKRDVECARKNDTVKAAAKKMRDENIGFLPICEDGMRVLGTITDRDLAIRVLADDGKNADTQLGDVMTREVVSCKPSDDVRHAEELLAKHKKSRIMCIDDAGKLVGVISLSDIAQRDQGDRYVAQTLRHVTQREATSH